MFSILNQLFKLLSGVNSSHFRLGQKMSLINLYWALIAFILSVS